MASMLPSRTFITLAALGLIPAVLTPVFSLGFPIALIYLALCGCLFIAGVAFGARPEQIHITRRLESRLSVGEWESARLEVQNGTQWPLTLSLLDTPPAGWEMEGLPVDLKLGPGEEATIPYRVRSDTRGKFQFGEIWVRLSQFPHLAVRQFRLKQPDDVRVYPDLKEVSRYELMCRRSRLAEFGVHRVRVSGRGSEFERIRDYTPDDEYRRIDWKATARRGRPMTRVYEVERSQSVLLVIDAGRMMSGRVGRMTKLDYGVNAALMLAHVALKAGDRVGLMIVSDEVDAFLPPGKGQHQFRLCLDQLYRVQPRLCHVDYRGAIEQIATRCPRRSLVVFLTDLVDEEISSELVTYMRLLRPVHLPLCVTLQDEEVLVASRLPCETADEMYRRAAAVELLTERRKVLDSLGRLGSLVLDVAPEELSVQLVNHYLELKARQLL